MAALESLFLKESYEPKRQSGGIDNGKPPGGRGGGGGGGNSGPLFNIDNISPEDKFLLKG
jgi:hypothetical protein